jgi:hypothetical protein
VIQIDPTFSMILTSLPSAPHAYIDPNTGGMLFQMLAVILAVFSGLIFFFSRQIKMIFARIKRQLRGDQDSDAEENEEQQN